jgi:hypothetical protein
MQKAVGLPWIAGFVGFLAAANAQTPSSPTASKQFDGTYTFVSAANVNETWMNTGTGRIRRCPQYGTPGPLIIENGHARYSGPGPLTAAGFEGTVGPLGQLALRLRSSAPASRGGGSSPGIEMVVSGKIDGNGTVSARQIGYNCSFDLIWHKLS